MYFGTVAVPATGGDLFLYHFHRHAVNSTNMTAEAEQC
jgi:hypothetical protein